NPGTLVRSIWERRRVPCVAPSAKQGNSFPLTPPLPEGEGADTELTARGPALDFFGEQAVDGGDGEGTAEPVALERVAAVFPQVGELSLGLDALGDDVQLQAVGHRHDRADDAGVGGVGDDVADE